VSVCLSRLRCAKTVERVEVLFKVQTVGYPRHIVIDKGPDPPTATGGESGEIFAHW